MMERMMTGQDLLNKFFAHVEDIDGVEVDTARLIKRLYNEGRLSTTNIANELNTLRGPSDGGQADQD